MKKHRLHFFFICLFWCVSHVSSAKNNELLSLQSETKEEWTAHPWISDDVKLGQVSGVSVDPNDNVYLFNRVDRVWDYDSFTLDNRYTGVNSSKPIREATILILSGDGKLLYSLGQDMFYLPHGITVDNDFNIWVTDVALHQVMKLAPNSNEVLLVKGEKFVPGSDQDHFCKPTSVAVLANGDFFVADGYCNSRIMKFDSEGKLLLKWGRNRVFTNGLYTPTNYEMTIPHALTIVEEKKAVCVADREDGRIICYRIDNGDYLAKFSSHEMGTRIFSLSYSPVSGGRFFVVNGKSTSSLVPVQGFVLDIEGGLVGGFGLNLTTPHDVATSNNGTVLYVVEIGPNRAWKFVNKNLGIKDSQKLYKNQVVSATSNFRSLKINPSSDEVEGLAGAILVTIGCFIFSVGIFIAVIFYSKSKRSGNADTKRLLSNQDY